MNLFESLNMAIKTIAANKLSSGLTMLGIIIGNASVITIIGIGEGSQNLIAEQFKSLGYNILSVLPGSPKAQDIIDGGVPPTLVLSDAEAIADRVPHLAGVVPIIESSLVVSHRNIVTTSIIRGTTDRFLIVRNFGVNRGRFITPLNVKNSDRIAILGTDIARRLFGRDDSLGKQIRIANLTFDVVGLMRSKGTIFGSNQDDVIFIPISTMRQRLIGNTSPFGLQLTYIDAAVIDPNYIDAAEFQITNLLRLRHQIVTDDDFVVSNQKSDLQMVTTITSGLTLFLSIVAGISLVVGGIGVMNMMVVSVTERTQEIGLRKAIGATQNDILIQFTIEAIILSTLGGIIGIAIGASSILIIGNVAPFKPTISLSAIVLAVTISGSIGLFFGIVPAKQAAKLDPIEALRSV
jgi:putative ABC transport system permease protein